MPTNLPPEYFEVEKRYKAAESIQEKIATLEEMISTIPKHKGTDKLRADYRRRLSKLKSSAQTRKKTSGYQSAFQIDREGAGQIVVIGPSNVGKSALVDTLTNATPEVSETPFTTWKPTPGMMPVNNVQVQLIDTPPLDRDYLEPELFDLIRRADFILLVINLETFPDRQLHQSIEILLEHNIAPLHLKEKYAGEQQMTFVPLLVLANKCDDESSCEVFDVFTELLDEYWPLLPVSTKSGYNLAQLKQTVFDQLGIIRVYTKVPGKDPDLNEPYVCEIGTTVEELAQKIHHDFYENLKSARVWGSSAFDGQMVQRDYVLHDEDIVELRT
jgi:ribosome-interacting GTPase 1